ncbi:sugar ABC transporter permease [Paenibacillus sp. HWE-109]|uniref:carbohydrate ABC transporter permease n=1 Tax=Paenibacillus sp. HWE-109 TaxID=1306526 RepID=UPI001EE0CBB2|nr:sugar ABC transporter permease [Paenibacillus sp. HWE-109]UKS28169.1 sugar ABC transporter permease [Paenibacillus sp. HWE-109]
MKNVYVSLRKSENYYAILFLAPFLVGFILFNLIPILFSVILSFVDYNKLGPLNMDFVGWKNYVNIFSDDQAINGYLKSLMFTLGYVPAMIILSLLTAILINKSFHLRTLIRTMIFMPYVANVTAVAMVWSLLFDPFKGPVNQLLKLIGVSNPPLWFGGVNTSLLSIVIVNVWINLAFQTIVFLAALQGVPKDLYESSSIDGAGTWRKFINITIPSISPVTFFLIVTSVIGSFQNYSIVKLLTNGGPGTSSRVVSLNIYEEAFNFNKYSYASAQAMLLFAFILIITLIQWMWQKKWVQD